MGFSASGLKIKNTKELTREKPLYGIFPEGELIYPLRQHAGKAAKPVVSVGDRVKAGQKIAAADGPKSAHIHASVSGKVTAIEARITETGDKEESIVILSDGRFERIEPNNFVRRTQISRKELLGWLYEAGVVDLGGEGISTALQTSLLKPEDAQYIIVNGVEDAPYLTSSYWLMKNDPQTLLNALYLLLQIFVNARALIVLSEADRDLYVSFRNLTIETSKIGIKTVSDQYAAGSERQILKAVTGKEINSTQIPSDHRSLIFNVETIYAMADAVLAHKPVTSRVLTLSGDAAANPGNYEVPIGTTIREFLEMSGGVVGSHVSVISGDSMRGRVIRSQEAPVTKETRGILVLSENYFKKPKTTACIHCGYCLSACPNGLTPIQLYRLADAVEKQGDTSAIEKARVRVRAEKRRNSAFSAFLYADGMECEGCGCCSYVCPAGLPLGNKIEGLRNRILTELCENRFPIADVPKEPFLRRDKLKDI